MKRKLLLFIFVLLIFLFNCNKVYALDCVNFSEGNGTKENPYVIKTPMELYSVSCNLDKNFILGNDIDLTYDTTNENGLFYNDGEGWLSFGKGINFFSGTFDGNNKKITGMYQKLDRNNFNQNSGLFGRITEGNIFDLNIINFKVIYNNNNNNTYVHYIGIIASDVQNSSISNINATGTIDVLYADSYSEWLKIGGLFGSARTSVINDIDSNVSLNLEKKYINQTGGIFCDIEESKLSNITNYGEIIGYNSGGIANGIYTSTINNVKNYGSIFARSGGGITFTLNASSLLNAANYGTLNIESANSNSIGGLVGSMGIYTENGVSKGSILEKSFNAGKIIIKSGTISNVGGLVGNSFMGKIYDTFNVGNIDISDASNASYIGGLVGRMTYSSDMNNSYQGGRINIKNKSKYSLVSEIIGYLDKSDSFINNIFYVKNNDGVNYIDNKYQTLDFNVLSINEAIDNNSYVGFNFDEIWNMDNEYYPFPQLTSNPMEEKYIKNIIINNEDYNLISENQYQLDYTILPTSEKNQKLKFSIIEGSDKATINSTGKLNLTGEGKIVVNVSLEKLNSIYATKEFNLKKLKDISKLNISNLENVEYDGNPKEPNLIIHDGDYQLVKGVDYSVTYDNNVEIGTASILVQGIGNYKCEKELTFKIIEPKIVSIQSNKESIDFGEAYINYDENIKKTLTITNNGNVAIKLSLNNPVSDGPFISVSFDNNKLLEPNETYKVTLAAGKERTYSDTPGTYNGNYVFTAKTLDETKSYELNIPATLVLKKYPMSISYKTHVQTYGWQNYVKDGAMSGTTGQAKRLEGIKIKLENQDYDGDIEYRTHIQKLGWEEDYKKNGEMSGTTGKAYRLEAIQIRLTGEMKEHFDVYYRVHAQKFGWLGWTRNDEMSGTAGYAYRLEGIEIKLVEKGQPFSEYDESQIAFIDKNAVSQITLNKTNISIEAGEEKTLTVAITPDTATDKTLTWKSDNEDSVKVDQNGKITAVSEGTATITVASKNGKKAQAIVNVLPPVPGVSYTTHVQTYGWQKYVSNGKMAGTQGQAKRLEGIKIKLKNIGYDGDIEYKTHIQKLGWEEEYKKNDEMSGTEGRALRLEAIQIRLTGEVAQHYDIYYRVHAQKFGWLGWAKNDEMAGTAGYAYRLEGIEIQLVEKGSQPTENENQSDKLPFYENK